MQLRIEVLSYKGQHPSESASVQFDEKGGSIGRSPDNDLCLNDPIVSSNHASISFEQNAFFITDHSTNGTFFLNTDRELRGEKVRLTDGDRLELGDHVVQICITENVDNPLKPQATTTFPDLESQFEFTTSEGTKERDRAELPSYGPPDPIEVSPPPVFDQDLTPEHHLSPPSVRPDSPAEAPAQSQEPPSSFPADFNPEDLLKPLEEPEPLIAKNEKTPPFPETPPPSKTDSEDASFFSDKTMPLDDFQPKPRDDSKPPSSLQSEKEEPPEADEPDNEAVPKKPHEATQERAYVKILNAETEKPDLLTEEVDLQEPTLRVDPPKPDGLSKEAGSQKQDEPAQNKADVKITESEAEKTDLFTEEIDLQEPALRVDHPESNGLASGVTSKKADDPPQETASEEAKIEIKEAEAKEPDILTEEVALHEPTLRVETPPSTSLHPEAQATNIEKTAAPAPESAKEDEDLIKVLFDSLGLIYNKEMPHRESIELIKLVAQVLKELTEGLRTLLRARAEGKLEMGMMVTLIERQGNNPLKFCPTVEDALKLMLIDKGSGFMDAVSTVRKSFEDVESHQMALNAGVQATLKELLIRLDPQGIEKKYEKNVLRKKGKCWDEYNRLYHTVVKEMHEKFFDKEFARAYEEFISKINNAQKNRQ